MAIELQGVGCFLVPAKGPLLYLEGMLALEPDEFICERRVRILQLLIATPAS